MTSLVLAAGAFGGGLPKPNGLLDVLAKSKTIMPNPASVGQTVRAGFCITFLSKTYREEAKNLGIAKQIITVRFEGGGTITGVELMTVFLPEGQPLPIPVPNLKPGETRQLLPKFPGLLVATLNDTGNFSPFIYSVDVEGKYTSPGDKKICLHAQVTPRTATVLPPADPTPPISEPQLLSDLGILLGGNLHNNLDKKVADQIIQRISRHASLYNKTIYEWFLGPRAHWHFQAINSYHFAASGLRELSTWDLPGSLANARAVKKWLQDSLMIYNMIQEKDRFEAVLDKQSIDDVSTLGRTLEKLKVTEIVIAELEKRIKAASLTAAQLVGDVPPQIKADLVVLLAPDFKIKALESKDHVALRTRLIQNAGKYNQGILDLYVGERFEVATIPGPTMQNLIWYLSEHDNRGSATVARSLKRSLDNLLLLYDLSQDKQVLFQLVGKKNAETIQKWVQFRKETEDVLSRLEKNKPRP